MKKVTEYDIEKIYSNMEKYLIKNIIRNLTSDLHSFHLKEEEELGFKWEAWQTAKLRDLQKFRRQNKDIVNSRTKGINKKIAALLNKEAMQGKKTAYKEYKEALTYGYNSSVQVKDSFFKMSSRKVRKLIGSVTNDFQKVNQATFRRSNDIYRQIIVEASMYKNTGVMTSKQAINKAIEDFKSRGINSIVYSNGSKHKISDYASMAIRTASTRAQLMGEGELRKKMGVSTIQMSKHSTSCKLCQPWEGKVLIDDVYSGGSKKDGNYPLLSDAMKQGLYHPNCRHGHGTYFPELSKKNNEEIIEKVEQENIDKNKTQEHTSLTQNEKDAVEHYVSGEGMWINQYLRGKGDFGELSSKEKDYLKNLDSATKRPLNNDMKLYRSVDASSIFGDMDVYEFEDFKNDLLYGATDKGQYAQSRLAKHKALANSVINKEFTEKGFMSTTKSYDYAIDFDGFTGSDKPIVLEINVPKGTNGIDLGKELKELEEKMDQKEVLLNKGIEYKVEEVTTKDGHIYVKTKIIEKPNVQKETKKITYEDLIQDDTDFVIKNVSNVGNVSNDRMEVIKAISTLNKQTQELIKNTTFTVGSKTNSKYLRKSDIINVRKGSDVYEIIHEIGHAVETKLNLYENEEYIKLLKNKFGGWMFDDLEVYTDDLANKDVYLAKNLDGFVSEYQSRAYITDKDDKVIIDTNKEIDIHLFREYFSEGFRFYYKNIETLKKTDVDLYNFIKKIIGD